MLTTTPAEVDGEPIDAVTAGTLGTLNYGHFTAMVADDLRVRGLGLHLERLARDCTVVFGAQLDPDRVRALLRRVAVRCDRPTLLRVTVFDPAASVARPGLSSALGGGGDPDAQPSIMISTRAAAPAAPTPGLRVRTADYVRDLPAVKHLGMFGPLHQRRLAQLAGCDDALFVSGPSPTPTPSDRVTEGPTWNVAVLLGDELVWPDDDCLPGVTRSLLHQVFDQAGVGWSSRTVTRAELAGARAVFATSAGIGVLPIAAVDGVALPGDPQLLAELQAGYAQLPGDEL